jgi:hypothetical protein
MRKTPCLPAIRRAELPLGIVIKGESGELGTIGVGAVHNDCAKMVAET